MRRGIDSFDKTARRHWRIKRSIEVFIWQKYAATIGGMDSIFLVLSVIVDAVVESQSKQCLRLLGPL